MAVISVTASQVAPVDVTVERRTFIANGTITPGQLVFLDTNGKAVAAKADAGTTSVVAGIALGSALAGAPVTVAIRGRLYGFDLSSQAYGAPLWLSGGTAGLIEDAQAGSANFKVMVGRVTALSDTGTLTKLLEVDINNAVYYGTAAITGV
jgi:hypothetical protein